MSTKLEQLVNDSIRGCLMAGAAGDALGYTVEFISRNAIIAKYYLFKFTIFIKIVHFYPNPLI